MKDNFSRQADLYAKFRPAYPKELFEFITGHVHTRQNVWDCATGSGQSAKELSRYFDRVIATDISSKQMENAFRSPNIFYSIQPAEKTDIPSQSLDLITVSQALHWFDFEKFYEEVRRTLKPGAWLAVWMYSLLRISDPIDKIIDEYHFGLLEGYWDIERKYVDDKYSTVPFPFVEIKTATFIIEYDWTLEELEGYLNTWSSVQKFISANGNSPVPELINSLRPHWNAETLKVRFPIYLKMGRVNH
jgi:ubiquinone/menaquinone biosynthesis C-methylase UbiE